MMYRYEQNQRCSQKRVFGAFPSTFQYPLNASDISQNISDGVNKTDKFSGSVTFNDLRLKGASCGSTCDSPDVAEGIK